MNRRLLAALAVAVLVATGCGEDDAGSAPPGGSGAGADAAATVEVGATALGDVLVGDDGRSLYLFTPDGRGASTCTEACADLWPPLLTDGEPTVGSGADGSLLGTVERDDGSTQVTYDEQPLYFYAPDREPGDVEGQGVNGVWYVVSPDGGAVLDDATATGSGPGPGY